MNKYHINKHGVPARCYAKEGNCPLGGESGGDNHFLTKEEAQAAADKINEDEFGIMGLHNSEFISSGKYKGLTKGDFERIKAAEKGETYNRHSENEIISSGRYKGLTKKEADRIKRDSIDSGGYKGLSEEEIERMRKETENMKITGGKSNTSTMSNEVDSGGYKGLSEEEIERMRKETENMKITGGKDNVSIMSNEDAQARLDKLKAQRFNIGTGEFSDHDFSREVEKVLMKGLLGNPERDEIFNHWEDLSSGKGNEFKLTSYVSEELKNTMRNEEPTYFANDDYDEVLRDAITKGTGKYYDEVVHPDLIRKQSEAERDVADVLQSRPGADLSTHQKMFNELKTFRAMNIKMKESIEKKIRNESDPRRLALLRRQFDKSVEGINGSVQAKNKLIAASDNLNKYNSIKDSFPEVIASFIVDSSGNKDVISDMRIYSKAAQERGNLYYNSNFK